MKLYEKSAASMHTTKMLHTLIELGAVERVYEAECPDLVYFGNGRCFTVMSFKDQCFMVMESNLLKKEKTEVYGPFPKSLDELIFGEIEKQRLAYTLRGFTKNLGKLTQTVTEDPYTVEITVQIANKDTLNLVGQSVNFTAMWNEKEDGTDTVYKIGLLLRSSKE